MYQDAEQHRRRRIIIGLQIVRFIVAFVMLGLAIYFEDMLLGILAIVFLAIGTFTTWKRLQMDRARE